MTEFAARSPLVPPANPRGQILLISVVAALGGLLFGYDTAVVSGAIGFLAEKFQMSAGMSGWAASSLLVGCMLGSAASGSVSDRFGRKPVLLICALLFALSAIASALAPSVAALAWARLLGGVAIGAVSMLSPMYIAEIAPEKMRGRLVGFYQLAIVIGILVVFWINWLIQKQGTHGWNVESGWRWMFGSLVIPSGLFGVLLLFVPESPRWLFHAGRVDAAKSVLECLNGPVDAQRILSAMGVQTERAAAGELWAPQWRRPLLVGVALAVFSQISGINAVMYYAPEIFKVTGGSTGSAFVQTIIIGVVNLVFTLVALVLVDRSGRRSLLLIGTAAQTASLALAGGSLASPAPGRGLLVALVLFVAAFAISTGPITWIAISEIFPNRLRGRAMSVAVLCLWGADWAVTQSFPMLKEAAGPSAIFWIYAGCSLVCLVCLTVIMPETKNRSLEEIESSWGSRHLASLNKAQ
jgi:SP family arabinose:H+ symporter-like MFS transporter